MYAKFHARTARTTVPKYFPTTGLRFLASGPPHAGRPWRNKIFPLPPKIKIPNLHIVRYTCQFEQYLSHRQNECRAHPSWAPTKEPTMSCWRYTPSPNQDRFQDLLEAICPDF